MKLPAYSQEIHRTAWREHTPGAPHSQGLRLLFAGLCLWLASWFVAGSAHADWSTHFNGTVPGTTSIKATTFDSAGNSYLVGNTTALSLVVGATTLTRIGLVDSFVIKRNADGSVAWAKHQGGLGAITQTSAVAVTVDAAGDVYVTGWFGGGNMSTPVSLNKIANTQYQDTFVLKLSGTDGSMVWANSFGGTGLVSTLSSAIAADAAGHIYVTGSSSYGNTTDYLTTPNLSRITPFANTKDAFLFQLDASNGNLVWAKNFGGTGSGGTGASASGSVLALDTDNQVYLAGSYSNRALTTPVLAVRGSGGTTFVFKIDKSDGTILWSKSFGGPLGNNEAIPYGLTIDSAAGRAYLVGRMQGADFATPPLTKIGTYDTYVVQLDTANGNSPVEDSTLWAKLYGGTSVSMTPAGMARGSDGKLYLAGQFTGGDLTTPAISRVGVYDLFALRISPADGTPEWSTSAYGAGAFVSVAKGGMGLDGAGNLYVGGTLATASLTSPAINLSATGATDSVWLKFAAADGTVSGLTRYSGGNTGSTLTIRESTLDSTGNVYVVGDFTAQTATLGSSTLNRLGTQDVFVAKLNSSGTVQWASSYGGAGASATAEGIAIDGLGNVYLSGNFAAADLSVPSLTKNGIRPAFLIKVQTSDGSTTGATSFYGASNTSITQMKIRASGTHIYVGGSFTGTNLANPVLAKIGSTDGFLIKVNGSFLTPIWATSFGVAAGTTNVNDLDVDSSGNVFLTGMFNTSLSTPSLSKIGNFDGFIAKVNNSNSSTPGTLAWAHNYGGSGATLALYAVRADSSGNVYASGSLSNGNVTNTSSSLTLFGLTDATAFKLDPAGNTLWAKNFGGSGAVLAVGRSGVASGNGKVFLSGSYSGANMTTPGLTKLGTKDTYVLTLNDSDGSVAAQSSYGGSGATSLNYGVAADSAGGYLIAGTFTGANLTTPALTLGGATDGWMFRQVGIPSLPGVPTGVTATAGNAQISIAFAAPANNGGAAIDGYTATCTSSDGGAAGQQTGSASPLVVTGLTNGKAYTCTVVATNSAGNSSASTVSSSATPSAPFVAGLNDTGLSLCYNGSALVTCADANTGDAATYPGQDGRFGRDAKFAAGALTKTGGGAAGFDFTPLDSSGNTIALSGTPPVPSATPACIRDNTTGLTWEVKTAANKDTAYTFAAAITYASTVNGVSLSVSTANRGSLYASTASSGSGLCGFTAGWRVPTRRELLSIVHRGSSSPAIDSDYFPNTKISYIDSSTPWRSSAFYYWTSDVVAGNTTSNWIVEFDNGTVSHDAQSSSQSISVRLVHSGL